MLSENHNRRMELAKEQQLRSILEDIPLENRRGTVVEMGAGKGTLSLLLKKFYPMLDIIIIDHNLVPFRKNCERKKFPSSAFETLEEDIRATSIHSRSVEWVFYHKLMHHLTSEDIVLSLEEASRILNEQGNLVIIDVNPQPQNRAQETLLKIYEIEAKIDLQLGKTPEKLYLPSDITNFLYKTGFLILKEKEYLSHSISLSPPIWDEMKKHIENSCKQLNKKEVDFYTQELASIEAEINSYGLETLPLFMILAKKSKITADSVPNKISSVKSRLEQDVSMLIYEKYKGLVMLNRTGALMWSFCDGKNSIKEIAEKVANITTGGKYQKILADTRGFFLSLFQKGFINFKEGSQE